jgi:hypothetical protein
VGFERGTLSKRGVIQNRLLLTFALFLEGWWVAKEADRRDEECAEAENRKSDAFDKYPRQAEEAGTEDLAWLLSLAERRWIIVWIWKQAVCEI